MRDLSLKGVARLGGISGNFAVLKAISLFGVSAASGTMSLRSTLETIARQSHSFEISECIYGWTAAYQQTWTHVIVRIRLFSFLGILPESTIEARKPGWKNGIETTWNKKWACAQSGELPCRISFEVRWVGANPHHNVAVFPGSGGTDMTEWFEADSGSVAAHEFGHMLGNADEYVDPYCPNRNPVDTGTIMDHNSSNIPARLVERIADHIGSQIVAA